MLRALQAKISVLTPPRLHWNLPALHLKCFVQLQQRTPPPQTSSEDKAAELSDVAMNLWLLCIAGAIPNSPTGTGQQGQATRSILWEGTEVGKDRPGPLCKAPLSLPFHICARSRDCSPPEAAIGTETEPLALPALEQAGGSVSPGHPAPLPPSALGPASTAH